MVSPNNKKTIFIKMQMFNFPSSMKHNGLITWPLIYKTQTKDIRMVDDWDSLVVLSSRPSTNCCFHPLVHSLSLPRNSPPSHLKLSHSKTKPLTLLTSNHLSLSLFLPSILDLCIWNSCHFLQIHEYINAKRARGPELCKAISRPWGVRGWKVECSRLRGRAIMVKRLTFVGENVGVMTKPWDGPAGPLLLWQPTVIIHNAL